MQDTETEPTYIVEALDGTMELKARPAYDGGLHVFDARGMQLTWLRASYVNDCGGALEALDAFYRDGDEVPFWRKSFAA